jgi:acetyl esterase/lipase
MRRLALGFGLLFAIVVVWPLHGGDDKDKIKTAKNIVYGKGDDVDLELDLAMPAKGKGPFPAVVCIHGGGWQGGSRKQMSNLTEVLAKENFVAVTISYRFAPKYKFPAQIEDCKAAVRFLRANAAKYNIDPDRIGAVGFSAGAHLSCLLGTADEKAGLEGKGGNPKQSSRVQAVVSYFGPTDFTTKNWDPTVEAAFLVPFLGGKYEDKKDLYRKCSPIIYCSKDDPPFLFFHGTKDPLVGIDQSEKMVKALKDVGVSAELVTMPGDGHGWTGAKAAKTQAQTIQFFKDKLKK